MEDKEIEALIERLGMISTSWHPACQEGADALRSLLAERDDLKHDIERHIGVIVELEAERDALKADAETLREAIEIMDLVKMPKHK